MARKIIQSIREDYERWFQENVSQKIPTNLEVSEARQAMLEARTRYESLLTVHSQYNMGIKVLEGVPVEVFRANFLNKKGN